MGMTTHEMAKALTVYIHQTFKLFGADIRYETVEGVLKGLVELPVEQLAADGFAVRLEFYGSDSKGGSAGALRCALSMAQAVLYGRCIPPTGTTCS